MVDVGHGRPRAAHRSARRTSTAGWLGGGRAGSPSATRSGAMLGRPGRSTTGAVQGLSVMSGDASGRSRQRAQGVRPDGSPTSPLCEASRYLARHLRLARCRPACHTWSTGAAGRAGTSGAGRATARRPRCGAAGPSYGVERVRPRGRPRRDSVAVTSGCTRTVTWWAPTVLIGWPISIRRLSTAGPPALATASTMSETGDGAEQAAALAGPDRQLDRERLELALDLAGLAEVADVADLAAALDRGDLLLAATGPADRGAARARGSCGRSRP